MKIKLFILSFLLLSFKNDEIPYYYIPDSFATKMNGTYAYSQDYGSWIFESSVDNTGKYACGIMLRDIFKPQFDSLSAGYWGVWDSTIVYLSQNDFPSLKK